MLRHPKDVSDIIGLGDEHFRSGLRRATLQAGLPSGPTGRINGSPLDGAVPGIEIHPRPPRVRRSRDPMRPTQTNPAAMIASFLILITFKTPSSNAATDAEAPSPPTVAAVSETHCVASLINVIRTHGRNRGRPGIRLQSRNQPRGRQRQPATRDSPQELGASPRQPAADGSHRTTELARRQLMGHSLQITKHQGRPEPLGQPA